MPNQQLTETSAATIPANSSYWNDTAARTHLFDAFSVMLPAGEAFVIDAVESAARRLPPDSPLRVACTRFVLEERSHQRAHRRYNQRLDAEGCGIASMEARIEKDLHRYKALLSPDQRLCLAAAFEHITATVSSVALRSDRVLTPAINQPAQLWRWHCAEEVAHAHVTADLLVARQVGYAARVGWYVLASLAMLGDLLVHMRAFYRHDVADGRLSMRGYWHSTLTSTALALPDLAAVAGGWASYLLPRRPHARVLTAPAIEVRALRLADLPALMDLESSCWTDSQAAEEAQLIDRMRRFPEFCWGAFCPRTGQALASLFMKPTTDIAMARAKNWHDCTERIHPESNDGPSDALFGISLSSKDAAAVEAIFRHFWPRALKGGWKHIYLGSPIPGFADWRKTHADGQVQDYVHQHRGRPPRDPQLRYYHRKGFRQVVAVLPDYFPHERSLDHGVLLRGRVPGACLMPLWRRLPLSSLQRMERWLFKLL